MSANLLSSMVADARLLTRTGMLTQAGLALSTVFALGGFSLQFPNPNEFKWEFVAFCNVLIVLELAIAAWHDGVRAAVDRLDLTLLAVLLYAAASVSWSADADSGKMAVIKWTLLAVPFLYLKHAATPWLMSLLMWAVALASAMVMVIVVVGAANQGGFGNENFLTEFQLLSFPFLLALLLREKHVATKAAILFLIGLQLIDLLIFNPSRIEWLVALGGLAAVAHRFLFRRYTVRRLLGIDVAVVVVLAGLGVWLWNHMGWPEAFFRESVRPRLALSLNTLRLWADAPFFGNGAGSFDALYPLYKEWHLQYFEHADKLLNNKMVKAGAAHNEALQFLAEYGLIGIVLAIAVLVEFGSRWKKGGEADVFAMAGAGTLFVGLIIGLLEFPLQNPATALLLAMGAGFVANRCPDTPIFAVSCPATRAVGLVAPFALSAMVLTGWAVYRFDQANRLFGRVSETIGLDPQSAFAANGEAYRLNPWDRRIRTQLYATLTFWTENSPTPVSSPEENDHIYAISTRGGENQPVLMLARVQHLLNSGRYAENGAETEALLAKLKRTSSRMADVWILEAYYALLVGDRDRAATAMSKAQALDPTPEQEANLRRLRQALDPGTSAF